MARFKGQRASAFRPTQTFQNVDQALSAVVGVLNAHDEELKKLNGGLSFGENTLGVVKKLKFTMPVAPPWRTDCAVVNAALDGLVYTMMEPGGRVTIKGLLTPKVGTIAAGTVLATMNAGYRIDADQRRISGNTNSIIHLRIETGGPIRLVGGTALPAIDAYVDSAPYWAESAAPPHQFTGGEWPLIIEHGLKKPCAGLMVLAFRLLGENGQNVGNGAPVLDWADRGDGTIRINGAWGLQWGRQYEMSVYLTPEAEE